LQLRIEIERMPRAVDGFGKLGRGAKLSDAG
jgi:hypothetical protein